MKNNNTMTRLAAWTLFFLLWMGGATLAYADYTVTTTANTAAIAGIGQAGRVSYASFFTTIGVGTVQNFAVAVHAQGSPTDNYQIDLEADSGGQPSNTSLGTATITGVGMSNSTADVNMSFSSPIAVSASTKYWLVSSRTGTLNGTNLYVPDGDGGSLGADQAWASTLGLGTWDQDYNLNGQRLVVQVVEGGGGGGGGGSATTSTTTISYIDNPNQNLFNGFLIFFLSAFGTMWVLRRRQ